MRKHSVLPFLLFLAWVEAKGQTVPAQYEAAGLHKETSILGEWCLVGGKDKVFMRLDTSKIYFDYDTLTYRVLDKLIVIDEFINAFQSTGFIRKLTNDSLVIEWATGDSNLYRRVR